MMLMMMKMLEMVTKYDDDDDLSDDKECIGIRNYSNGQYNDKKIKFSPEI